MRRGYSISRRSADSGWLCQGRIGGKKFARTFTTRLAAEEYGKRQALEAARVKAGIVTPEEHKARAAGREPVEKHVAAWEQDIINRGRTKQYAAIESKRVAAILGIHDAPRLADLDAGRLGAALASVATTASPQTANHYRTALRMFCRWCVITGRLRTDPSLGVPRLSAPGKTRSKYAFTDAELAALIDAAEHAATRPQVHGGGRNHEKAVMPGPDRAMYYYLMAHTGFRKSEAASLTPESFDLEDLANATVTVQAAHSKHRREDTQPLRHDAAERLRSWILRRPVERILWRLPANWRRQFHADCRAAGIQAPQGVTLGVHCLRRFYITSVVRGGGLAVGQRLARHSTPKLTSEYADLTIHDQRKALEGLPGEKRSDGKRKQA